MVGHSSTRAPNRARPSRNSCDCEAARVMRTVLPRSSMLTDLGQNVARPTTDQLLPERKAEFVWAGSVAGGLFDDDLSSGEIGHQTSKFNLVSIEAPDACDGNLAASLQG